MKIAVVCHPTQGGSGIVATELATALAHRGHEVHLAAWTRPYRLAKSSPVIFHEIELFEYPLFRCPPYDYSLANRLAGIIRKHGIDIIHAHYAIPHAIVALLARQVAGTQRAAIVTTLHGTDITLVGSHHEFYDLTRHAMVSSDGLTAVSQWLCDQTMERFALPQKPEVIHNFVDPARFHPRGRAGYPPEGKEFHLIHASNLRPVKRIADVIRVFAEVQKSLPVRLTVLGEGPEKGPAEVLAEQLGIAAKVHFTSTAESIADMMRSAHVNLLLSEYESFGVSALEGMACGTPCAASGAGGLPEVIEDGRTGMLCPVGDIGCTSRRIVALLRDRARWEAMSAATAESAHAHFGLESVVPRYEALYARVAAQREGTRA